MEKFERVKQLTSSHFKINLLLLKYFYKLKDNTGNISLTTVLIVTSILFTIASGLILTAINTSNATKAKSNATAAEFRAKLCLEDSFAKIKNNNYTSGIVNNSTYPDGGKCSATITDQSNTVKNVSIAATVSGYSYDINKLVDVTVASLSPNPVTFQQPYGTVQNIDDQNSAFNQSYLSNGFTLGTQTTPFFTLLSMTNTASTADYKISSTGLSTLDVTSKALNAYDTTTITSVISYSKDNGNTFTQLSTTPVVGSTSVFTSTSTTGTITFPASIGGNIIIRFSLSGASASSINSGKIGLSYIAFDSHGSSISFIPRANNLSVDGLLNIAPKLPTSAIGSVALNTTNPQQLVIQGRYAYVVSSTGVTNPNTLRILDISNPSSPVLLGSVNTGLSGASSLVVQGKYAFVASATNYNLAAFNIYNPTNPTYISSVVIQQFPSSSYLLIQGKYVYIISTTGVIFTIDISNPSAMFNAGGSGSMGGFPISGAYIQGNFLYAVSNNSNRIFFFNLSASSNPVYYPTYIGNSFINAHGSTGLAIQGKYAYIPEVSGTNLSLEIIDTTNYSSISVTTQVLSNNYTGITVQGKYAYINYYGGLTYVYDISTPTAPILLGSITLSGIPLNPVIQGRYLYTISGTNLQIFDMGGAYIQHFEAGTIEAGSLSIRNSISATEGDFRGGLTVGQSLNVNQDAGIGGSLNIGGGISQSVSRLQIATQPILTGTGTVTTSASTSSSGALVTGSGVSFNLELTAGSTIYISGQSKVVQYIVSSSQIIVDSSFSPDITTATSFTYAQPVFSIQDSSGLNIANINNTGILKLSGNEVMLGDPYYGINGNATITAGPSGNPYSNNARSLTLQSQYTASVFLQNGISQNVAFNGTGLLFNTQGTTSTVFDSPYGGNAQNNFNINQSSILVSGAAWNFRSRNNVGTVSSIYTTLNGSPIGTGDFSTLYSLTSYPQGTATVSNNYDSNGVALQSSYWNGSTPVTYSSSLLQGKDEFDIHLTTGATNINSTQKQFRFTRNGDLIIDYSSGYSQTASINSISGTNQPLNFNSVTGSTTGGVQFYSGSATSTVVSSIDGSGNGYFKGNVGIGTNSPITQLHVNGYKPKSVTSLSSVNLVDMVNVENIIYGVDVAHTALQIIDISNPTTPVLLSSTTTNLTSPKGISVQGKYAYIVDSTNNALVIFNISNPYAPILVSSTINANLNGSTAINVSGKYAYIGTTAFANFYIWDISNPLTPTSISTIASPGGGTTSKFIIKGKYAFAKATNVGIYDISNISSSVAPSLISTITPTANAIGIALQDKYLYVSLAQSAGNGAVNVWDISNPATPSLSSSVVQLQPIALSAQGRYLYVTDNNSGALSQYDISNPSSISFVASTASFPSTTLFTKGRYVYTTGGNLAVVDVGGAYIQQLEAGGIDTSTLTVKNNLNANNASFLSNVDFAQDISSNGKIIQNFTSSNNASVHSIYASNSNSTSTVSTIRAVDINLTGATNANSSANILTGINFGNVTPITNNIFNGLTFGTGYNNFLTSSTINISATGQITGATGVSTSKLTGNTTIPTNVAGTGSGTTPTIAILGTDVAGQISVTTGTTPTASAIILTVTFTSAYASAPFIVITPGNVATATLSGNSSIYVTPSTTNFTLNSGSTALTASTPYIWYYHVIQ